MTQVIPTQSQAPKQPQLNINNTQPLKETVNQSNNQETANRQRKRRLRRHRKNKLPPQEIKEVKLQRLHVKREVHWNNRFVLDTIPDIFAPKPKKRDTISRGRYPLHSAYVDKDRPRLLPELYKQKMNETVSRNNHKSFKIRQIKKDTEDANKPKEETIEKKEEQAQKKEHKKKTKKERNKQKMLIKLQEKVKLFPINQHYQELLKDVISLAIDRRHKSVRTVLQKEIDSIGGQDNVYTRLQKLVGQRKGMLNGIRESGAGTVLKSYLDLQIHSLLLVQQILKFKAFWQGVYLQNLRQQKKVNFYYQGRNYLLEMNKQVKEISQKDPFLVEKTGSIQKLGNSEVGKVQLQERKEMMLKIRACQLLLIEEQLLASI